MWPLLMTYTSVMSKSIFLSKVWTSIIEWMQYILSRASIHLFVRGSTWRSNPNSFSASSTLRTVEIFQYVDNGLSQIVWTTQSQALALRFLLYPDYDNCAIFVLPTVVEEAAVVLTVDIYAPLPADKMTRSATLVIL